MKILILENLHGNNKGKKMQWRLKRTNLKVGDTVILDCHDWKIIKVIGEKKRSFFPKGAIFSEYSTGFIDNKYYKAIKEWAKIYDKEKMERIGKILIVKNIETGECRKVKANEIDCFDPNVEDHINHYEIIVKIINKEVKKVSRPYFEMEVVEVKKEKCKHLEVLFKNGIFKCTHCGHRLKIKRYDKNTRWGWTKFSQKQQKGNWVNGENLDKIKFPCFCSYSDGEGSERKKGFLSASNGYYYIADITNQKKVQTDVGSYSNCYDLKTFIRENNIHILKGKIIIYENI